MDAALACLEVGLGPSCRTFWGPGAWSKGRKEAQNSRWAQPAGLWAGFPGCRHKTPDRAAPIKEIHFLTVLEAQGQGVAGVPSEAPLLGLPTAPSHCVLTGSAVCACSPLASPCVHTSSFYKVTSRVRFGPPLQEPHFNLVTFVKALPPNTVAE